ncbi:MAG TPA: amidohydrolase family protein [Terriglobales bacterium]|nr:amidohydrolase family protein [Terriglobales bacterium]
MCDLTRASDLAVVGAKIYPSPAERPIENGTILIHDGHILAVGPSATVKIPRQAEVIDCKGLVVTAGFWNSHVHILTPGLLHAEKLSPEKIDSQLQEMLTRWGFTTVFDIASLLDNTTLIRRRIESGEVKGPRILTVGEPFWMKGGTPIYVRGFLEANHINIPEVESTRQATERVRRQIRDGADGIKIFANSIEQDGILTMPLDLARAIVTESHRAGKPVFAHVSNDQGIEVAVQSGVDILAHTTPADDLWSPAFAERLKAANMALTPTLTLWEVEYKGSDPDELKKGMGKAAQQLKAFSQAGGQILFGTDVGYIERFDTSEEYTWMSRAGMSFQQILASLTTNPAQRFGDSAHSGRIAKGMDGDLVVLQADPAQDAIAFSKVRYTIRGGNVIYSEK